MRKSSISLFLSLAALFACGSETSTTTPGAGKSGAERQAGLVPSMSGAPGADADADAPMTIGSLVPEGTLAWVRVSSFDALGGLVDEFLQASGAAGDMDFDALAKLSPFGGALEHLDRTRELGLAIGYPDGASQPALTVMLPVTDRGGMIQALRGLPQPPECFGIDAYVVATSLDEYRPGVGSVVLTDGLPAGDLAARLDLQALMQHVGPLFELGLQQVASAPAPGLEGLAGKLAETLRTAGTSAESVDLALTLEDGEVDFSLSYVAAPDSELDGLLPEGAGNLYDLAHCAGGDDTMSMLVTIDTNTMQQRLMPLFTETLDSAVASGQLDEAMQKVLLEWGALLPLLGDSVVVSAAGGGESLNATYFCRPPDRDVFRESLEAVLAALDRNLPGLGVSGPREEGSLEIAYDLSIVTEGPEASKDLARLFPSGSATLRLASRREVTVITLGDDDQAMGRALERVAAGSEGLDGSVGRALERVGDANPAFVTRIDLVGALRGVAGEAGALDPQAGPQYVTYYGGVNGRVWKLGFRADLSSLGAAASRGR